MRLGVLALALAGAFASTAASASEIFYFTSGTASSFGTTFRLPGAGKYDLEIITSGASLISGRADVRVEYDYYIGTPGVPGAVSVEGNEGTLIDEGPAYGGSRGLYLQFEVPKNELRVGALPLYTQVPPGTPTYYEQIWVRPTFYVNFTSGEPVDYSVRISAAPEPSAWGLMILGFGAVGAALRRRGAALAAQT